MEKTKENERRKLISTWYIVVYDNEEATEIQAAFPCVLRAESYLCSRDDRALLSITALPWYQLTNLLTQMAVGTELGL